MFTSFALLSILLPTLAVQVESKAIHQAATDADHQFDFWVGEWTVQNRNLTPENTWEDGDVTRARITPVCGGKALLEEWAGPFHGSFMNGFSLRSYDIVAQRWTILLFWTTDGNGSFGRMNGRFRHGRGEFLSNMKGEKRTRYTFSDGLPSSVRWDQATTRDSGRTWLTDWIMEFNRTRAAQEVTQGNFFTNEWTTGQISPHKEARALDWMLGEWTGTQVDASDVEKEARLRCKLVSKDCLFVDLLETRTIGTVDWHERISVRGYQANHKAWQAWTLTETDSIMRPSKGVMVDAGMAFVRGSEAGGVLVTETTKLLTDGRLQITSLRQESKSAEAKLVSTIHLSKVQSKGK